MHAVAVVPSHVGVLSRTSDAMKACVIHGARDLRVSDRPQPAPGPAEVLIKLGAAGICGSDLHYFAEGGAGDFRLREPMILGHEGAGRIVTVGDSVSNLKPGDRVAVNPNHPCGRCRQCQQGRRNLCRDVRYFGSAARFPHVNGLFAELFVADAANCYPIPERLSDRAAACAEPLAIALHAASQAGSLSGLDVCIVGSGPIGALVSAVAKMSGAARVCATDLFDEPLTIARAMGATETVNVRTQIERLQAFEADRGCFDVTFEASGHPSGLSSALAVHDARRHHRPGRRAAARRQPGAAQSPDGQGTSHGRHVSLRSRVRHGRRGPGRRSYRCRADADA